MHLKKSFIFLMYACLILSALAACQDSSETGLLSSYLISQDEAVSRLPDEAIQELSSGEWTTTSISRTVANSIPPSASVADAMAENMDDHETAGDYQWDSAEVVAINLNGDSASISGEGVLIEGSNVTITSPGTYSLSGALNEGQIMVDTEAETTQEAEQGTVRLILDGVNLINTAGAPIFIKQAEKTILILAPGSENQVSGGAPLTNNDDFSSTGDTATEEASQNAAIFSEYDLSIYGNGSLQVFGTSQDGITSKDGLILAGGTLTVEAIDDGIRGKDYLVIKDGTLTVVAQGDGLKSDNDQVDEKGFIHILNGTLDITTGGDALQAETDLLISGGIFNLVAGGGSRSYPDFSLSRKGIKAGVQVIIDGGTFNIDSADDAVHSNGAMVINAGSFTVNTADDGFHADASLEINGGTIRITKSYEGLESAIITINAGDISIYAEDDGINIVAGVDESGMMMRGQGQGGRIPPGGEIPQDGWSGQEEMPQGDRNSRGNLPIQDNFASSGSDYLAIHGGSIHIDADGDGIDVNGSIEMTGGLVLINGPTGNMNGALDCIGTFQISGGFLVAVGSAGMAEAPDDISSQNSLLLNFSQSYPASTAIYIRTSDGEEILAFEPTKSFQSIAFSSPDLLTNQTYEVYLNEASYTSFTVSSVLTRIGQRMQR